jgi:MFS family permease
MLSSILALAWAASGAFFGAYTDRKGKRKTVLILSVLMFSLCSALSGLVGGFGAVVVASADGFGGRADTAAVADSDGRSLYAEPSRPQHGLAAGLVCGLAGRRDRTAGDCCAGRGYGWRTAFYLTCVPG